jgi:hypothetical protein
MRLLVSTRTARTHISDGNRGMSGLGVTVLFFFVAEIRLTYFLIPMQIDSVTALGRKIIDRHKCSLLSSI